MLRAGLKGIGMALIILRHLLLGAIVSLFVRDDLRRRKVLVSLLSHSCRSALRVLQIKVRINEKFFIPSPALFVSNHLSYLDVLVISSWKPAAFVTSVEIRETPFLGRICLYGGSHFVERRNTHSVRPDLRSIARSLQKGINVSIFPEATSTDGSNVLPFKRGLLTAAQIAKVSIQPLCLNYLKVDGRPLNSQTRDILFYYGEMSFFPHLKRLLQAREIEVELEVLEPLLTATTDDFTEPTEVAFERVQKAFQRV